MTICSDATRSKTEGGAFIESLKKRLGTAALAGALVPLAVAGMTSAAVAGTATVPQRSSFVEGSVNLQGSGQSLYEFEVFNTSDDFGGEAGGFNQIVNWELPLFSLNGIDVSSINSPTNWTFEIIDIDGNIAVTAGSGVAGGRSEVYNVDGPFGEYVWDWTAAQDPVFQDDNSVYGPDPDQFETPNLILHWYTQFDTVEGPFNPIFEGQSLAGFDFLAADGATNAPYQASWLNQPPTIGDPPTPQGAAVGVPNNAVTGVPEPGAIALFATGLLGLLGLRRRRKSA